MPQIRENIFNKTDIAYTGEWTMVTNYKTSATNYR